MPTHQQVIEGLIRERDELREMLRLAKEPTQTQAPLPRPLRDSAEAWFDYAGKLEWERSELRADLRRLTSERDELRQALRDYGEHEACCPRRTEAFRGSLSAGVLHERGGGEACACGLEELLAEGGK